MKFRLAIKGIFKLFRISKKRGLKIASIILLVLFGVGLIWGLWKYFDSGLLGSHINVLFGAENGGKADFLRFLATIVAGILAFIALYYNAKRTKALDKQNEIAEKGKIDDRFKNAIEHLGKDESPTIVLGGIYSMHQIARDHEDYRKTVFEILCSYIREKTASQTLWADMTAGEQANFKTPITIQTCIDLLFKHEEKEKYIYEGLVANLQGVRCPKADFSKAYLDEANLIGGDLVWAYFNNAHLAGVYLMNANLKEAQLIKAHLVVAHLMCANFMGANLKEAHLEGANLWNVDLTGCTRKNTNFTGVDMTAVIGYTPNETDIF